MNLNPLMFQKAKRSEVQPLHVFQKTQRSGNGNIKKLRYIKFKLLVPPFLWIAHYGRWDMEQKGFLNEP
jgi:hypothetical protein